LIQKAARQFGTSGLVDPVVVDRHSSATSKQEHSSASEPATSEQHCTPSPSDVSTAQQSGDSPEQRTDPSKLRFDDSEQPQHSHDPQKLEKQSVTDKQAARAQSKAEHSAEKLEKAKAELPKKYRFDNSPTVDAESGKIKRGLHFEAETKGLHEHLKGSLLTRQLSAGANAVVAYGHKKVFQAENENVGTQAAHKSELLVEGALRTAHRRNKEAPYDRVSKLERKTSKLTREAACRRAIAENPRLQSGFFSRLAQKHRLKREHAKKARDAGRVGGGVSKGVGLVGKASNAVAMAVKTNPKVILIIAGLGLLLLMISSAFSVVSNMASSIGTGIIATSYLAEDEDISNVALVYSQWETELQERIRRIETEFPGYDEYRIMVDNINHDPNELVAFLTAVYGRFNLADAQATLRQIFDEQYQLTIESSVEIRYYRNADGELVPYEWRVLTVTMRSRALTDVIWPRMNDIQRQHFTLLMQSRGNRQLVGSPFEFNWIPFIILSQLAKIK
ncbi:MAG: hypothetical protein FWE20_10145, partial [Defluviitaleaceae bacterium]|nr:hypothetical protein [Defluviitaleaceae bacterium]